jgi:SAM-dependent methyltransferase
VIQADARLATNQGESAADIRRLSEPRAIDFPDTWYDLSRASHFWFEWRLRALLRMMTAVGLPAHEKLRTLDVGGGVGILRDQLEDRTVWSVDLCELNAAALAAARKGRGERLLYDIVERRPDYIERYDVVILFDILEHLADPATFVAAALAHLRPAGWLLINVPALSWLFSKYDEAAGHLRRYDRRSLPSSVGGLGVDVVSTRYWGLTLIPLLAARRLAVSRLASDEGIIRRGFQPPHPVIESALRAMMRIETLVFAKPWWGSSLLLAGRKR